MNRVLDGMALSLSPPCVPAADRSRTAMSESLSRRIADFEHLTVKTEFSVDYDATTTGTPDGLLTPISSRFEDPLQSSSGSSSSQNGWSFVTRRAGDASQSSSSVSSFHSPQEPTTPPYHGGIPTSVLTPIMPSSSMAPPPPEKQQQFDIPSFFSSPMQAIIPYRSGNQFRSDGGMMPAAQDFASAMGASMAPRFHPSGAQHHSPNHHNHHHQAPRQWVHGGDMMTSFLAPGTFGGTTGYSDSITEQQQSPSSYQMPVTGHDQWQMSVSPTTVVPNHTIVDAHGGTTFEDSDNRELDFSSPSSHRAVDAADFAPTSSSSGFNSEEYGFGDMELVDEHMSEEASPGASYSAASYSSSAAGGGGGGGGGSSGARPLRKSKRSGCYKIKTKSASVLHKGREITVAVQLKKPHPCHTCGKRFQRPEHLRRHEQTHNPGAVSYQCPDPDCPRSRGNGFLARMDNLREHFKTHLRESSNRRNNHRTFEQFYAFLRDGFDVEEAEKYVDKLEKWRLEGGHLKPEKNSNAIVAKQEANWNPSF
jgi:hypothetical protein